MRLKTKLVLAITGLVFLVVTVLSWLFLEQLLAQRISQSYAANDMVARQILYSLRSPMACAADRSIPTIPPPCALPSRMCCGMMRA
jgi:hypothetical protein